MAPIDEAIAQKDIAVASEMSNLAMDFVEDLEKFAEMAAMLVIGSLLSADLLTWHNAALAACLMFLVRPIAVYVTTMLVPWTAQQRRIGAWLGIRGVGSAYYLAFALTHGLSQDTSRSLIVDVVLFTVAASVLLHGISATPIMDMYKRHASWRSRR